jgi:hypothetical protein
MLRGLGGVEGTMSEPQHLGCPYCCCYEVDRLYLASARVDSCLCRGCGDEELGSGEFRGRSERQSAVLPRS